MKHLQKFESFLIPKPIRKFHPWWKDEDIALEILKDLKSIVGNSEAVTKMMNAPPKMVDSAHSFTVVMSS